MKKWVREKFCGLEKALKLQAKEYERRLKSLNGEAGRLRTIQSQYIPREVFDRVVGDLRDRVDDLSKWRTTQEAQHGRTDVMKYVPHIVAVIAVAVSIYAALKN